MSDKPKDRFEVCDTGTHKKLEMLKWVSVEDRLPDLSVKVLVYWRPIDHEKRPWHREITTGARSGWNKNGDYSLDSDQWWINGRYYDTKTFITHWMPLPESPE